MGSYSHAANLFLDGFSHDVYYSGGSSLQNSIIEQSSRLTPQRFWGAYSLNYACQYRNWFQFGGTITYAFATQSRRDLESDKIVERMNCHAVSLMPTCRFTYLNRERVQLYSAVSTGVIVGTGWAFPWMDATLFGCSFGKKVFGFAELGTGLGGWGRVGIGYRFDAKKK